MHKGPELQKSEQKEVIPCAFSVAFRQLIPSSKIDELEKHVQELRSALDQNRLSAEIPGNSVTDIRQTFMPQTVSASYSQRTGDLTSLNSPPISNVSTDTFTRPPTNPQSIIQDSPRTSTQSSFPTLAGPPDRTTSRPGALKVRAIESTALSKEQIDLLFQMLVPLIRS